MSAGDYNLGNGKKSTTPLDRIQGLHSQSSLIKSLWRGQEEAGIVFRTVLTFKKHSGERGLERLLPAFLSPALSKSFPPERGGGNENVDSFMNQPSEQEVWLLSYTGNMGFAIQLSTS